MPSTLTKTSTLLLAGLQDPRNQAVWMEFDTRYRPVLFGVARRLGLSSSDAEEVVQQTLAEFARDFLAGKYDRQRGRLHSWIFGILQHRIIDLHRAERRNSAQHASAMGQELPDEAEFTRAWDTERAAAILRVAVEQLREDERFADRTLDAFVLFGLRSQPCGVVAEKCGMSTDDVYAAKYRVGKALQAIIPSIDACYDL